MSYHSHHELRTSARLEMCRLAEMRKGDLSRVQTRLDKAPSILRFYLLVHSLFCKHCAANPQKIRSSSPNCRTAAQTLCQLWKERISKILSLPPIYSVARANQLHRATCKPAKTFKAGSEASGSKKLVGYCGYIYIYIYIVYVNI